MVKKFKIRAGQRIVKTSVSAAAAMMISNALKLDFSSLAIVAAIVILQPTFHETINIALKRLVGTIIGCSLALLCVYYLPMNLTVQVLLGTFILLSISSTFSVPDAGVLGIIAFVSIITDPSATVETAAGRLANTSIGAFTSITMNSIFPVQSIELKFKEMSFKALKLNLKLLRENLNFIVGKGKMSKLDFDALNNKIITAFDEVYKVRSLMSRERKFAENSAEYRKYREKFKALWDIHSCVMQIQISASSAPSLSHEILSQFAGIGALFDTAQKLESDISDDVIKKLEYSLINLEAIISDGYDGVSYSEIYEEGSFLAIMLANLKRITETLKVFKG